MNKKQVFNLLRALLFALVMTALLFFSYMGLRMNKDEYFLLHSASLTAQLFAIMYLIAKQTR